MKRKLRVAFSAACGIICLLLIALWVRSHHFADVAYGRIPWTNFMGIDSKFGQVHIFSEPTSSRHWSVNSTSLADEGYANAYRELPLTQPPNRFGIGFTQWQSFSVFHVPHYVLAIFCAVLGSISWMPRRFSLRTLLISMALVAALLGAVIYAVR